MSDSPIERENLTAALVRDHDDEALVGWILGLQDREEELEARVTELEAELRDIIKHYDDDDEMSGYYRPLDDAIEAARTTLAAESTTLGPADSLRVATALLDSPEPTEALQALMREDTDV